MPYLWTVYRALLRATFKEYTRDLLPLIFSLGLPLFFIISFGATERMGQSNASFALNVAVVGDNAAARDAFERLSQDGAFHPQRVAVTDLAEFLQAGKYQAVLLPAGTPGGEPARATVVTLARFEGVGPIVQRALNPENPAAASQAAGLRVLPNGSASYFRYVFPAILAISLLQVALFGTAAPIISAKEKGLYRQYRIVPMPRLALLAAQVSVRVVVSLVQIGLLTAIGCLIYQAPIAHPFAFVAVLVIATLTLVSYGYAIAGLFSRMGVATGVLMLFNFYCMLFGQMFNDLSDSAWKWLLPTTPISFVSEALRMTTTGQHGLFEMPTAIAGMLAYLLASTLVGTRYFRFEQQAQ
ncbi:ABC transporter permease [Burkholderia sp. 22PA0106]|uniref:ABC transporter permease n=1 Tax=Burkholderia sp. 22PA0106 TaxID=3237371 RepID=UPI0039C41FD6